MPHEEWFLRTAKNPYRLKNRIYNKFYFPIVAVSVWAFSQVEFFLLTVSLLSVNILHSFESPDHFFNITDEILESKLEITDDILQWPSCTEQFPKLTSEN